MGRGAAFSPDGRLLVFQDAGVVKLWDRAATRIVATLFANPAAEITALAFSPDGKTVTWGDQTSDEMMVGFFDIAIPSGMDKWKFFERPCGSSDHD